MLNIGKRKRLILSLGLLGILLIGLVVSQYLVRRSQEPRGRATANTVTLSLLPAQLTVAPGQAFSIAVYLDTGNLFASAADLRVTYNLQLITGVNVDSLGTNNFFTIPGTTPSLHILNQGRISTSGTNSGLATVTLGTGPTSSGKKGVGQLALINFTAGSQPGTAAITIDPATLISAIGMHSTNVVGTRNNATISIVQTSPAPSPTTLPTYKVFNSSTSYNGNLGGLTGADAKCQSRAAAAGLTGTYKAWLSSTTINAKDRLPDAKYV